MPLSQRDDLGQTLGLDRAYEPFRIGIQIWASDGKLHGLHFRRIQDPAKRPREQWIAVVNEAASSVQEPLVAQSDVAAAAQSEPSKLPAEMTEGCGAIGPVTRSSPVRVRKRLPAKTPRNRVFFSVCIWMYREILCSRRLNGGGGSRKRTRLFERFAETQTKAQIDSRR